MKNRILVVIISAIFFMPMAGISQNAEKVFFDPKDSTDGYYLAVLPQSGNIQGVQVLFSSFNFLENILPETKLQNVAYGNDILTIIASLKTALSADTGTIDRINHILNHIAAKFSVDTSKFVLGGYEYAGTVVLRYTELTYEDPSRYPVHPKAVFVMDCPVDLVSLVHWSERELKKNYSPGSMGDAKYILNALTKEYGELSTNQDKYISASPFEKDATAPGNELYLKNLPVRLYYDTDINWELKNRRNSYYDTFIPDGSELVSRLLLLGNNDAEFIPSKLPGMRSNGIRNPHSWSIVDETDCIQWIKQKLKIFDPNTYVPVYHLSITNGWGVERFPLPPEFARQIPYAGIEDVRFAPGWGDVKTEDYWSYAFLWWMEANPSINASALQENLKAYYSGLVGRNIPIRKIPTDKLIPTVVTIKKTKSEPGDEETYTGSISMLDYMTQTPMVLNAVVHLKKCPAQNHTALFFEISPKPSGHVIWKQLDQIWAEFRCTN